MRHAILGTAGHIDHGKTALVRALTGIAGDRLPEEKARGITIDLGFAHGEFHGVRFGFVDVPGHERFVRNMLAGAVGIDVALLIVSAVESVRAQTREHLELLRLLGVQCGVIALTKADAVDADTLAVAELEVRELVRGTFLEAAPIIATSALTGQGLEELKGALAEAAITLPAKSADEPFRLAIDRAFTVAGHGTVVTGTVAAGSVDSGTELDWLRDDGTIATVRVRSLANHSRAVERIDASQRAALNLAGVELSEVHRGQTLAAPGSLRPTRLLTVKLASPDLSHRTRARLHLGTADIPCSVANLDGAFAQLHLERFTAAVWGQRFVLRDPSGERTLGGGVVLQPNPVRLRRRNLEAIDRLAALANDDPAIRVPAALWFASAEGFDPSSAWRDAGTSPREAKLPAEAVVLDGRYFHPLRLTELEDRLLTELTIRHSNEPLLTDHDAAAVLVALGEGPPWPAVAKRLRTSGRIVGERRMALADFKPKLSAAQRKLKDRIVEAYRLGRFEPPEPETFARIAGSHAATLDELFEVAVAEGLLVHMETGLYLHSEHECELRWVVSERLALGPATVAELRDALGTTRKFAIPFCEYLDRIGFTRRTGDLRERNEKARP